MACHTGLGTLAQDNAFTETKPLVGRVIVLLVTHLIAFARIMIVRGNHSMPLNVQTGVVSIRTNDLSAHVTANAVANIALKIPRSSLMTTKIGDKGTALLRIDLFYHFIGAIEMKNANLLSVEYSQIVGKPTQCVVDPNCS